MIKATFGLIEDYQVGNAVSKALTAFNSSTRTDLRAEFSKEMWPQIQSSTLFDRVAVQIANVSEPCVLLLDLQLNITSEYDELKSRAISLDLDECPQLREWSNTVIEDEAQRINGFLLGLHAVKNCPAPQLEVFVVTTGGHRDLARKLLAEAIPETRRNQVGVRVAAIDGLKRVMDDPEKMVKLMREAIEPLKKLLKIDGFLDYLARNPPHSAGTDQEKVDRFVTEALSQLFHKNVPADLLGCSGKVLEVLKTCGASGCSNYKFSLAAGWILSIAAYANAAEKGAANWQKVFTLSELTDGRLTSPYILPPLTLERQQDAIRAYWHLCMALFRPRPIEKGGDGRSKLTRAVLKKGRLSFELAYDPCGADTDSSLALHLEAACERTLKGDEPDHDVSAAAWRFWLASSVSSEGDKTGIFWNFGRMQISRTDTGTCLVTFGTL